MKVYQHRNGKVYYFARDYVLAIANNGEEKGFWTVEDALDWLGTQQA